VPAVDVVSRVSLAPEKPNTQHQNQSTIWVNSYKAEQKVQNVLYLVKVDPPIQGGVQQGRTPACSPQPRRLLAVCPTARGGPKDHCPGQAS